MFYPLLLFLLHTTGFTVGLIDSTESVEAKCIEKERHALLNFKQSLVDYNGILSTWSDNENNSDCCKWKGIQCNNQTGHVNLLDLRGHLNAIPDHKYLIGKVNLTSLIDLHNIEHLDLSNNDFVGSEIPQVIGSFTNLTYLNLSYSYFTGRIPSKLGDLSQLQFLDLRRNDLEGPIPFQIGNLRQLQYLDLNSNSFVSGAIPFQKGNLPILHTLRLGGYFDIKAEDADWLSNLHSLTNLELTSLYNLSSSPHWLQAIRKLVPNLRELRLVDCSLSDTDLHSLFYSSSNFSTSLTILDLSYNMVTSSAFQLLFNFSHNLQELYLSQNNIVLSSPLRRSFPSLVILDLSYNIVMSFIFQGGFNFSSKLQNLNLQDCRLMDGSFQMSSTSIMNSSSSLVFLDLSYNLLKSSTIFYWLFNHTTNIRTLSLSGNLLEGPIPDGFGKVMNSLEDLDLSDNKLQDKIPTSLGNICTLQRLYLGNNNISGGISSLIQNSSWCKSHAFQTLDVSNNRITGMLPNLANLRSLKNLDLSSNQLTGEIPRSIGLLNELKTIHLEENYLEGDIIASHLTNLSKLEELDLTDNSLSLKFGTTWVPSFQLFELGLGSCKLGPSFPSWLQTQSRLQFLDMSDAELDDFVPDWFWNKLQSISALNMSYNSLKGIIPNLPIKLDISYGTIIVLKSNKFEGAIPTFLSQVFVLDLSKNKISNLNTFLCGKGETTNLFILDLSHNQITGQLPDCWEHLNELQYLDLSNNRLSGKIPQSMGTLVYLQDLVIRSNSLTGHLPLTLKNCTNLDILDVSENLLSGPIPSWIGESLKYLRVLSLRVNQFFGNVPLQLCYLRDIIFLDLSRNNLSEEIPTCLGNFSEMKEKRVIFTPETVKGRKMSSRHNYGSLMYDPNVLLMWKGQEQVYWNPENLLKSIDLSSNALTGEIPKEVGYLLELVSLNLSRNNLSGEIPFEIGNLNSLDFLDLSRNHLSGKIPSTLSNIDRLAVLDLSNNDLVGRIPWGRQLQTFDASSFEGNLDICGKPLAKSCPGDDTLLKPKGPQVHDEDDNAAFYEGLYMSLGFGFFTGFWGLLGPILFWRPWRNAYLRLLTKLTDYVLVFFEVNMAKFRMWLKG